MRSILGNFQTKVTEGHTVSRQALIDLFIHRVTVEPDVIKCELTITTLYFGLVEMRGVEPLSENIAIQLSPSADVIFCFALRLPDDGPSHRYPIKVPLRPTGVSYRVSHN